MKKKKMIYLPEDREAAEILKSLTIMLKVLIKDIKECETISMLKLCTYCPSLQVIIKNKGLRKDVKTLSQSLRDSLLSLHPAKRELIRLATALLDKSEEDLQYKALKKMRIT